MSCSAIAVSAYQAIADAEDDPDEGLGYCISFSLPLYSASAKSESRLHDPDGLQI